MAAGRLGQSKTILIILIIVITIIIDWSTIYTHGEENRSKKYKKSITIEGMSLYNLLLSVCIVVCLAFFNKIPRKGSNRQGAWQRNCKLQLSVSKLLSTHCFLNLEHKINADKHKRILMSVLSLYEHKPFLHIPPSSIPRLFNIIRDKSYDMVQIKAGKKL